MSRRPTIKDVAARARVSAATVSHAYSGKRRIARETRDRIFAAAEELGYTADPHARSMRTRRSGMVGLVLRPQTAVHGTPDSAETFNRLTGAIATHCLRRGVGLVHIPVADDGPALTLPMDGCIVAHPYAGDDVLADLRRRGVPVVCIDPDPDEAEPVWTVEVDYLSGMRALIERVESRGARRLLMLPGAQDNAWNRAARRVAAQWDQHPGCRLAAVRALPEAEEHAVARAEIRDAVEATPEIDAIAYADSSITDAVLDALNGLGRRVPDDLQLAAFTDTAHSRHANPPVSAMDLRHEETAVRAVDLLLQQIEGGSDPGACVVTPSVAFRGSTRAPTD